MAIAKRRQSAVKFERKDWLTVVPLGVLLIAALALGMILGVLDKD